MWAKKNEWCPVCKGYSLAEHKHTERESMGFNVRDLVMSDSLVRALVKAAQEYFAFRDAIYEGLPRTKAEEKLRAALAPFGAKEQP